MNHRTSILCRRNLRAYAAAFVSYLMLAGQVAPLALGAAAPRAPRPERASEAGTATTVSAARPAPAPFFFAAPVITATKVDSWDDTATPDGKAEPGQVVTYTVTITNTGDEDATNVKFSDVGDPNTSLVSGSVQTQPIARADTYSAFGNVRISTTNGAANLLANDFDPDTSGSTGLTVTSLGGDNTAPFAGTSANSGNVSATTGDGSFEYNPAPGFTGTDSFTYTVTDANGKTDTATATVTVGPTLVWFINNASAAGGDGRLTSPFNSIAEYNASAPSKDPNDIIFIYQGGGAYAGNLTLTSGMKLIGQGFALQTETGAPPTGSDPLPGATANPVINSAAGNTVTLNQNNTVRGLTLNNAAGIDIFGSGFGTLTVSNVTLSGTGRPLSLTTGTVAATFDSITATSASGGQGILLSAVGGSLASTGGTSITGATTQGILVTGSTVTANFGNTTISGGTDAVSLQNNSSGTRTFGTLTTSGNTAVGFLHGAGGGTTNITGATSITNPGGAGIDIQSSNAAVTFAATTVGKNNAGTAVNLTNNGTSATSFASLAITASSGAGLVTSAGGNLTVTTGSINATGTGVAASLTNTALNLTFTTVSSNGGANGVIISGGTGSFTSGTTTLQNNAGIGLLMSSSAVAASFGNTSVTSSSGDAVDLSSNSGAITFADLDMTPDAGLRGLDAQNNTGAITATSGDVTTSGGGTASAVFVDGPAGRTPIDLTFTSVTTAGVGSGSASVSIVDASGTKFQVTGTTQINTRSGRGVFVDNTTATTIQFATVNIPNPSNAGGNGFHVEDSSSNVTVATATISDANVTVAQTDPGSDGIPDTDGDGDGIFLRGNTGLFTLSGGTISNPGNDGIDARTSRIAISGVTITNPGQDVTGGTGQGYGGHGISAINLTGANTIASTTISGFNVANRDGLLLSNTTGTMTMMVTGSTFQNATGNAGIVGTAAGTSNVTLTVGGPTNNAATNCTFTNISASAVITTVADTATMTSTVQRSTFQNAPTDGKMNVTGGTSQTGHGTFNVLNNTFTNVFKTASTGEALISYAGGATVAGNTFAANVSGNTINGVGQNSTLCGGGVVYCAGPLEAILIFIDGATDVSGTIVVDNNNITNVQQGGVVLDMANSSGGPVDAKITNNVLGTDAAPIGIGGNSVTIQSGVRVIRRRAGGQSANVLVNNNSIRNGSAPFTSALNGPGIFVRGEADTTMSATITNNNVNTLSTGPAEIRVDANSTVSTDPDTSVVCADINGNTLAAGAGTITLNESPSGNVLNIEQASAAALAAANGIPAGNVTVSGTPQFGIACATPPAGPVSNDGGDFLAITGVPLIVPAATDKEPASKNAFGGGVTDRPFLSMPRGTRAAAAAETAARSAAARKAADASAQAEGSLATGQKGASTTGQGAGKTATSRGPIHIDNPGEPNGSGVGISNFHIGTLPAGDSVTITFQVTIDNPYSGGPNVSNQGTVTADGGISVPTDDPDAGGASDPTLTPVNSIKIFAQNGTAAEPATGTAPLLFTVTLSAPATGAVSVNYATADGGATPAEGGAACGGTVDYESTNGTLVFAAGQQVKTVSVNVCADSSAGESNETLLLNLSGATGGNIQVAQATGTITQGTTAGTLVISELRTSGPGGTNDDFVEFYNNTDAPLTVAASDASAGYGVFAKGADCNAAPVLIATIPNGTVIPARGHYLAVGTAYSLANYGGTGAAAGNVTFTTDLGNDANVAVFTTADAANVSTSTRLDAVGFGANAGGGVCDLLREGNNLPPVAGSTTEHSFFRKQCDFVTGTGCTVPGNPKDTNDNAADFMFADTLGSNIAGVPQQLGAPGPENLTSPVRRDDSGVSAVLLDSTKPSSAVPNRSRDFASGTNASFGTLSVRRRVTNNTGGNITRLRFRIVELTTFPVNTPGNADLRALSSTLVSVSAVNDPSTCPGGVTPCTVPVQGTTLEQPPAQPEGGAYNSTLAAGTITTGAPLAPGASINVQFLLGIETPGKFRFYIIVEALP